MAGDAASGATAGGWRWDVALSFAGTQRSYVERVAAALKAREVRVFYDADEQVRLWGTLLAEELPRIYAQESAAVVVFVSADYAGRDWTRLERRAAFSRAVAEAGVYVLPARFDDSELPGLLPDVGCVDLQELAPEQFADLIAEKLAALDIITAFPPHDIARAGDAAPFGRPVAFLSYANVDDDHTDGALTAFHRLLAQELRLLAGEPFPLFRDRDDLEWARGWRERIDGALDSTCLLVAIVSPNFFLSGECQRELARFVDRERRLGARELILPVYWIEAPLLQDKALRSDNALAECIAVHRYADWRQLRFSLLLNPEQVRPRVADLAKRMVGMVDTAQPPRDGRGGGRSEIPPVAEESKKGLSDQWRKDLMDLQEVEGIIDQDMKRQIQRAILIRRFGEFG